MLARYSTVSFKSLALWRIALGATCVQFVVRRWSVLDLFYTESGVYPIAAIPSVSAWQDGPLYWVKSPVLLHAVFALCLLVTVAFTAGLGTRYVKWLLLPVLVTLDARVLPLFTGGEAVLHGQALYATLLPVGTAFSVDAWLGSRRPGGVAQDDSQPNATCSLVYPLLLLQLAVIYFFNERAKMGDSWHNGTAVVEVLGAATLVTKLGAWVRHWPSFILRCLTYGTLFIEGVLPFLLLSPWARRRTHALAAVLMLALHGGIFLSLDVGSFSAAMLSYVPLLLHPQAMQVRPLQRPRWARRLEAVAVVALLYIGAARLSRDLILWPDRPRLPFPTALSKLTRALGLWQPWVMFSPHPPERDFIIVTDAVSQNGLHFDPWRRVASGYSESLKTLPQSVVRAHLFTRYENQLSIGARAPMHPYFARWVLSQQAPDGSPVERFDAWLMMVSTNPALLVPEGELDKRVGMTALPLSDPLPIKSFEARGVWAPERALDRRIAPEESHVSNPVGAVMSGGCPHLTLDLGEARTLKSAYLQADTHDYFILEASLDGQTFRPFAEMPRVEGAHFKSRIIPLPADAVRYVRLRPAIPRGFSHFLSEIALFDHEVSLPPLTSRPTDEFFSSLARPSVAGIVSGSNHPDCKAEDPRFVSTARAE
ncbi:MAG: hypothetical protein ABUL60_14955 [Myxococcales bacterium]